MGSRNLFLNRSVSPGRKSLTPFSRFAGGVDIAARAGDNARVMAEPSEPPAVKLICGMICADEGLLAAAVRPLAEAFGEVDLLSDVMAFDFTHYYDDEMGSPLHRRFVSFAEPVRPDELVAAKLRTNSIEADFARKRRAGPARPINLDAGYVEPAKLVLASMKNFSHRIYLGRGVWAEVTLMYHKDRWEAMPWTFPDYASGRYDKFLTAARNSLRGEKGALR